MNNRRFGKNTKILETLVELSQSGKGSDTMLIAYPNAPFHYKTEQLIYEIDRELKIEYYQKKVYDYPIKTVDEWLALYQQQGYFVR